MEEEGGGGVGGDYVAVCKKKRDIGLLISTLKKEAFFAIYSPQKQIDL